MVRPRNLYDNAVPVRAPPSAIDWLLRLALFFGEERYESLALKVLRPMADLMGRYPSGFGRYLGALDFHLGPTAEIAARLARVGGRGRAPRLAPAVVFGRYLPSKIVAGAPEGAPAAAGIPLLAERRVSARQAYRVPVPALCLPVAGDRARRTSPASSKLGYNVRASRGEVS